MGSGIHRSCILLACFCLQRHALPLRSSMALLSSPCSLPPHCWFCRCAPAHIAPPTSRCSLVGIFGYGISMTHCDISLLTVKRQTDTYGGITAIFLNVGRVNVKFLSKIHMKWRIQVTYQIFPPVTISYLLYWKYIIHALAFSLNLTSCLLKLLILNCERPTS